MLPPDWDELGPLLDEALDAPREQRAARIVELSGGDPQRQAALQQLVIECDADTPFFRRPAGERFAGLFDEERDVPLPEVLGGRYEIVRELGRGGMGRVYLAQDGKHARRVAVKVIRAELAASLARERFLREIGIAARLRHPNIVPVYDSGDMDGLLYFVMPYEEGPSLRSRLSAEDPLTNAERVSTLRDVARALAYAHEQGVVHRDVKPDNVLLSGGAAVVADFGISKAVSAAQDNATPMPAAAFGTGVIGTPAYMAPEQAANDSSTDHRADIYSFGCLAYELFAGKPPFHGLPTADIIAAHRNTRPIPVSEIVRDIPAGVAAIIGQCLEKNPDARPQSAQELVARLEGVAADSGPPPPSAWQRRRIAAISTIAAFAMFVLAARYVAARNQAPAATAASARTVAVLPLVSASGDSIQQQLAGGLSDEIAAALFKVSGIRVVSRRGADNYRGRDVEYAKAGRELGARFLVIGSLGEVDGRLVVLAQLLNAADGAVLWADRYDRNRTDLAFVRDDIVRAIGDTLRRVLRLPVSPGAGDEPPHHVVNDDAYRLYLLAQQALDRRGLSIRASVDRFRQATIIDTLYAKAYSGLSLSIALSPHFSPIPAQSVSADALRAAERAMLLDPTLAQPHIARGIVYQNAHEWERAGKEFTTAIAMDGRDVEARVQYGRHLLFRDRATEALGQFLAARAEDPASALVSSWVSYAYYVKGQLDSAVVESVRAYQSDPNNTTTLSLGALVRFKAGQIQVAREFIRRGQPAIEAVFYVLAATGDTAEAERRLRKFASINPAGWRTETNRAFAMLGAGDTARALTALERATDANEIWPTLLSTRDPVFDAVRASPRFQEVLRRVGLR